MEIKNISNLVINLIFEKSQISSNPNLNPQNPKKEVDLLAELYERSENLDKFSEKLNKILDPLRRELRIEIDPELNIPVFKIIDKETNEVIRQIPWEEILKLIKSIEQFLNSQNTNKEHLKGLLLKVEV